MNLRENMRRSKEILGAYFRQGLHELGSVAFGPGTAAQHAEYGMIGTKTPGQVADGLRGTSDAHRSADDATPSPLDAYLSRRPDEPSQREPGRDIAARDRD